MVPIAQSSVSRLSPFLVHVPAGKHAAERQYRRPLGQQDVQVRSRKERAPAAETGRNTCLFTNLAASSAKLLPKGRQCQLSWSSADEISFWTYDGTKGSSYQQESEPSQHALTGMLLHSSFHWQ